jgi:phosphomannomutase
VTAGELRRAAEQWLAGDPDETTREELGEILARGDDAELIDRFRGELEFGTAGLRGVLGAGPSRMNRAVVIRTTAGLASYLATAVPDARARGVVIGCDARRMSRTLTEDAASVLSAAGYRVMVFPTVVPTPLLAFAVGALHAVAGIMITASHNAADYNGYKLYWENGAQVIPPHDAGVAAASRAVGPASSVPRTALADARASGSLSDVPGAVRAAYLDGVRGLCLHPELRDPLRIVYTPLHGVGLELAQDAFRAAGFGDLVPVPEQADPDPAFPTTPFPNPEEEGVMDLAVGLGERLKADLVIANDPDADRLAVAVPRPDGSFARLTGNQIGVLLGHYLLGEGRGGGERLVVTTIVSSPLFAEIARSFGVACEETLTGFKWMENRALDLRAERSARLVFAYEEALGYSVGELVRDKDGVSAAVLFAELAQLCRAQGSSILDLLESIARRHGLFVSSQRSVVIDGADGPSRAQRAMAAVRATLPGPFGALRIREVRDYLTRRRIDDEGRITELALPPSDVVALELERGTRVVVRPSGTEPKIKIYFDHKEAPRPGEPLETAERRARAAIREADHEVSRLLAQ